MSALTDPHLSPQEKWSLLASQMHQKALDDKYYQEKGTKLGVHNDRFRDGLQRSNYGGDDLAQILMAQRKALEIYMEQSNEMLDELAQMRAEMLEKLDEVKEDIREMREQYEQDGFFIDEDGDLVDENGKKLTGEALTAAQARLQEMKENGEDPLEYAAWLQLHERQQSILDWLRDALAHENDILETQENASNMTPDQLQQQQQQQQDNHDDLRRKMDNLSQNSNSLEAKQELSKEKSIAYANSMSEFPGEAKKDSKLADDEDKNIENQQDELRVKRKIVPNKKTTEIAQSTGDEDPWAAAMGVLDENVETTSEIASNHAGDMDPWATAMDVLDEEQTNNKTEVAVTSIMRSEFDKARLDSEILEKTAENEKSTLIADNNPTNLNLPLQHNSTFTA